MKKRYEYGGEIDAMEEANKRTERTLTNPNAKEFGDAGTSETSRATPKAASKPAPKAVPKPAAKVESKPAAKVESKPAPKAAPVDVTKLSVAERRKLSRENPSVGGPTDTRSVGERLKSAFGMKSGGSVGSASRRGDGIATKGKTKGTMVKMNYGGKC
jgi:outer membrane biosynthesis protein TonB